METRQLILGTAGHIDHGKTALVRALTGIDTDRLPQEKARGITIDIGFAHLDVPGARLGIVDVPGHERFIRNMLAGAAGIDLAMLVVAGDDSVMPQTVEHLSILQMLDVRCGLIALSKCDLGDADWIDLVEQDVRRLVRGTFLENAPIVRTSATTGLGLEELKARLGELAGSAEIKKGGGAFRLAVDRAFVKEGLGTIVTGTVWNGAVGVGDEVQWLPAGQSVRVRGIQSHGRAVERVSSGQRAALNLGGVHHSRIARGHELVEPGSLVPTRLLAVDLHALAQSPWSIRHRSHVRLHIGTGETIAEVRLLEGQAIEAGGRGSALLACGEPVVARGGQAFVVRAESPMVTLGGGHVLLVDPRGLSRRRRDAVARLAGLRTGDATDREDGVAWFLGEHGWDENELARQAGLEVEEAAQVLGELEAGGRVVRFGSGAHEGRFLHADRFEGITARILALVDRLHADSPLEPTIARGRLMQRLSYMDQSVVDAVLDRMGEEGTLVIGGSTVARAGYRPPLSDEQRRLVGVVLDAYREGGFSPPDAAGVASLAGVTADEATKMIELCAATGSLTHLGAGLYLHEQHEREMRRRLGERMEDGSALSVSQIRNLLGTSRKFAVPFCEYLDRIRFTRRRGDVRVLVDQAAGVRQA